MKRFVTTGVILALGLVFLPGCTEKTSIKEEKTISSPTGTTTTTTEKEVEQSGSNPPPP